MMVKTAKKYERDWPMHYASGYSLHLYCLRDENHDPWDIFPHEYFGETFADCAKEARKDGWIIRTNDRTAICPECSGKKR